MPCSLLYSESAGSAGRHAAERAEFEAQKTEGEAKAQATGRGRKGTSPKRPNQTCRTPTRLPSSWPEETPNQLLLEQAWAADAVEKMPEDRAIYGRRKCTVEPVFTSQQPQLQPPHGLALRNRR